MCFGHCIGLPFVELVEAHVGVDLVDRPLAERSHFGRHLAVAGEQGHADGVEVIGQELELVGGRANGCALDGGASLGAQQGARLAVAGPAAGGGLVEIPDRCVERDDRERRPLVERPR